MESGSRSPSPEASPEAAAPDAAHALRSWRDPSSPLAPGELVSCTLPTRWGRFMLHGSIDAATGQEHAALSMGDLGDGRPVLTRVHSECLTGDTLFSLKCDCGAQLEAALKRIAAEGRGLLLYLRQEGRGIGLVNKIRAYALQEAGADTVEANRQLGLPDDARNYAAAATMIQALGVGSVRLMTNNPAKVDALRALGVTVVDREPLRTASNPHNRGYLRTKAERMGHHSPADDSGLGSR